MARGARNGNSMSQSVRDPRLDVPLKMLAVEGEEVSKPLAEDVWRRKIGGAIERGIVLARLSKQDVAYQMGYADQSALARWISGAETAQLPKLFRIEALRQSLVIALGELAECEVETVVRIRRRA